MSFFNKYIKWIMLVSGGVTFTMVIAAVFPQQVLSSMFGTSIEGPLAEVIVRNWGALIALIGGMLIYGAYKIEVRHLVLTVAALSKIIFIVLVVANDFAAQLIVTITFDAILILLFAIYLILNGRHQSHR